MLNRSGIWAAILFAWSAATAFSETPRVAIMASDKAIGDDISLVEAAVSSGGKAQVVERAQIDRALNEQALAAMGSGDPAAVVKIGRELNADLFAVAEATADSTGGSIVVFDAATGSRLSDVATAATGEARVARFVQAVDMAADKWRRKSEASGLRSVCLQTVRNVDLPRNFDRVAGAVGVILTRRLTSAADVVVLERRWLERVTQERLLTGSAATLTAATVSIELQFSRRGDEGIEAVVVLNGSGERKTLPAIRLPMRHPAWVADALAAAITDALRTTPPAGSDADGAAESRRFVRETVLHWQHKELDEARSTAEAAYALDPASRDAAAARARAVLICGLAGVWQGDFADLYRRSDMTWQHALAEPSYADALTQSLQSGLEAADALRVIGPDVASPDWRGTGPIMPGLSNSRHDRIFRTAEGPLRVFLGGLRSRIYPTESKPNGYTPVVLTPQQSQLYCDLKNSFRGLRLGLENQAMRARVVDAPSLYIYSSFVSDLMRDARCIWAADGRQWTEEWATLIGQWNEALSRVPPVQSESGSFAKADLAGGYYVCVVKGWGVVLFPLDGRPARLAPTVSGSPPMAIVSTTVAMVIVRPF